MKVEYTALKPEEITIDDIHELKRLDEEIERYKGYRKALTHLGLDSEKVQLILRRWIRATVIQELEKEKEILQELLTTATNYGVVEAGRVIEDNYTTARDRDRLFGAMKARVTNWEINEGLSLTPEEAQEELVKTMEREVVEKQESIHRILDEINELSSN